MLRILRSGQRWLTAILVAGIGTVFVVFLGLQGPSNYSSSQQIVKVGPLEVSAEQKGFVPPVAGVIAIAAGIVLVAVGRQRA